MRRAAAAALALGILALVPMPAVAQQDHVIDESDEPSFLLVVSAGSGSVEGSTLTLVGVPSVIYFSDRPVRIAGQRSVESFVATWDQGDDSFAADPPNAVLSLLDAEGVEDSVIELTSAELDGDALRFGFTVLEGSPPEGAFGPASLFIDRILGEGPAMAMALIYNPLADGDDRIIPRVSGLWPEQVGPVLANAGLVTKLECRRDDEKPRSRVYETRPAEGGHARVGDTVTAVYSPPCV